MPTDRPQTIVVSCPATGQPVGSAPVTSPAEVDVVAARLRAAQPAWQQAGVAVRARWLSAWRDWILDHTGELLELVQQESGKSWGDANIEVWAVDVVNYWIEHAAGFLADETVRPVGITNMAKRLTISYQPYPLVGVITPWNYPLAMPLLDIAPALMAGCAVLSKPSEVTPLAWRVAAAGWKQIGAPDVLDVACGAGETGAAVTDVVDYVMFTGSVDTGRRVAVAAAQRLIPCSLELGGKDAMIVCADADLDRAADGAAWAGFFNSGQTCVSVERVYVEAAVHDEFVGKLVAKTATLRQGMDDRHDYSCDIGAMASAEQLAKVARHVDDAVRKGAQILTGGKAGDIGLFYPPTVLVDVDHGMDCMSEETFGPVLPVMKVGDAREAIALTNDSRYGLSGSVWTRDRAKGLELAREMDTGSVNINNAILSVFQYPLPMQGWKESGPGLRAGGASGIRKYCRTKGIAADKVAMRRELFWYPYTPWKGKIQSAVARLISGRDWRRRLGR